ncbi:uncharacterized protein LOC109856176 [Pseudomyrmex gracilis]|uniref:uncharacterized protein LOC109856176 n=1 Tax=Pseudomyrmex gracilis TaxID=219809 RepID=UPI000994A18D|nr:uncharacterized protein LOC109856176 [Pseudomyrmex gracilis]XP_020286763.1 uncharacterized protein LOC109856176 [Pseudomyrmex gracilis]XP_020286771.1 uncharacterized protein LOC109856176 [Pseudomyrmex gracilis]XP_020286781.1 uncharacterized protein LOC109856176 [Pseudomyrmex gracilis]
MAEGTMPTDVRSKMQNLIREFEMHASLASIKGESTFLKSSTSSGSNVKKKIEIFNLLSAQSSMKDVKMQPEKSFSSPAVCGKPSSNPCGWDKSEVSSSLPSVFKKTHDFENVSHYRSKNNEKTDLKRWWGITNMYNSLNKLTRASSRFLKRRDKTTKTKDKVSGNSLENDDSDDTWKSEAIDILLLNRSRVSCNSTNSSYTNLEIDIFDFENEERRPDGFSSYFKSSRDNTFNERDFDSLLNSSAYSEAIKEDSKIETSPEPMTTSPIERKLSTKDDEDTFWTPTRDTKLSQRKSIGKLLSMVGSKLKTIGTKSPKKEERQCTYSDSGCEQSLSRTDLNCSSLSQKSRSFADLNSVDKEPLALSTPTFTTFGHAYRHHASRKLDEHPGTTFAEVSCEEVSHRQFETSRSEFLDDHTPKRSTSIEKRKVHFTSNAVSIPGTGENHHYRIDLPQKFSDEHPSFPPNPPSEDVSRLRKRRISKQFVAFEENDQTGDEALSTEEEDDVEASLDCESSVSPVLSPPPLATFDILKSEMHRRTSSPKSKDFQIEDSTNEYKNETIQKILSFLHRKISPGDASDKIFRLDPSFSAFANLYQQSEPHRYATVNPNNLNFFMSSKKLQEMATNCNEMKSY